MSDARWSDPREYDARDRGDEVHHVNPVDRGLFVPGLLGDGHAGGGQLILEVLPGLFDGR